MDLSDETFHQINNELTLAKSYSIAIKKYPVLGEDNIKTLEQKINNSKDKIYNLISTKNKTFFNELGSEYRSMYGAIEHGLNALGYKKIETKKNFLL